MDLIVSLETLLKRFYYRKENLFCNSTLSISANKVL